MDRRRRSPSAILLTTLLLAAACGTDGTGPTSPTEELSPQARSYLEQVIGLMQNHSLRRLEIDWVAFRESVLAKAAGAQSTADTYPAIRHALTLLADGHSSLRTPAGTTIFVSNRTCTAATFSVPTLPSTIGYVRVGAFSGSGAQATAFATNIQNTIRSNDGEELIGWIVDLRGNGGGNMWPMIAGIGPILGEGIIGYFIDPLGAEIVWEYRDGASWLDGNRAQQVESPYRLHREQPRVAVLTDNRVASSGEAVVIAFRQRPDTRSFGTATCGLSTANRGFPLSDGAVLFLTVSVMADRTRTPYGDSVTPDETITEADQVVQRAVTWLQSGS